MNSNNLLKTCGMQRFALSSGEGSLPSGYDPIECVISCCSDYTLVTFIALDALRVSNYSRITIDYQPYLPVAGGHMGCTNGFDIQVCTYNGALKWFTASASAPDYLPYKRVELEQVIDDGYGFWYVDGQLGMSRAIDETNYGGSKFVLFAKNDTQTNQMESVESSSLYDSGYTLAGACFGIKAWDKNGDLFMNLVPCVQRRRDDMPGFYDLCGTKSLVSNTPFYYSDDYYLENPYTLLAGEEDDEIYKNMLLYYASEEITPYENNSDSYNIKILYHAYNPTTGMGIMIIGGSTWRLPNNFKNTNVTEIEANPIMVETEKAFQGSTSTHFPILPESVTVIGDYTYSQCSNAVDIPLRNGIESFGTGAFSKCTSLVNITLPSNLQYINMYAFSGCTSLVLSTLPNKVRYIGSYAFQDCKAFTSMTIPASVSTINAYAFKGCDNLATVTFLSKPSVLSQYAFNNCSNLTVINVPWSSGAVSKAPWGATNATVNYNYTPPLEA